MANYITDVMVQANEKKVAESVGTMHNGEYKIVFLADFDK